MITVVVSRLWSDGEQVTLQVPQGTSLSALASQVGAPSGCTFRVNGASAGASTIVGNGDIVYINKVKYDAGR